MEKENLNGSFHGIAMVVWTIGLTLFLIVTVREYGENLGRGYPAEPLGLESGSIYRILGKICVDEHFMLYMQECDSNHHSWPEARRDSKPRIFGPFETRDNPGTKFITVKKSHGRSELLPYRLSTNITVTTRPKF